MLNSEFVRDLGVPGRRGGSATARRLAGYDDHALSELIASCPTSRGRATLRRPCGSWWPTQKPYALVAPMLENSTKPGDVVLDPFGGSGSTLMACEHLGRRARLLEIGPRYCDVIVRRWEKHTGRKAGRHAA